MERVVPDSVSGLVILDAGDVKHIAEQVDFVFSAVDMDKDATRRLEEKYARSETPVVSNNSAHRDTPDVPVIIPEVNWHHAHIIHYQRERLGTRRGFIATKPNCSLQSYVPALHPLKKFGLQKVQVCTYQALSGAGKILASWPEMADNVIPFINGEEAKSEIEPLKIWGWLEKGQIVYASKPVISAQCVRVPVSNGHLAALSVSFAIKPYREEIIELWKNFKSFPQSANLPRAPKPPIVYFEDDDRPQTRLDRDASGGMGITVGRLRPDTILDYKFVCLSHNTIRGAAGGAILMAETLQALGFLSCK